MFSLSLWMKNSMTHWRIKPWRNLVLLSRWGNGGSVLWLWADDHKGHKFNKNNQHAACILVGWPTSYAANFTVHFTVLFMYSICDKTLIHIKLALCALRLSSFFFLRFVNIPSWSRFPSISVFHRIIKISTIQKFPCQHLLLLFHRTMICLWKRGS